MNHERANRLQRQRRRFRVRRRLKGTPERPRLSVNRSLKHIYVQLIDDAAGKTLCAASTRETELGSSHGGGNCDAAAAVGKALADRAKSLGISQVCFDRGSYMYHGRVAALANAAREGGLQF